MNISIIVGAIVFFGSVILSQKLVVSAGARLDDQTKLTIADVFPKRNVNYSMIVFGIIVVFLIALFLWPHWSFLITVLYAIAFSIYILAKLVLNVRKLSQIGAPDNYIRSVKISFAIFIFGAICAVLLALAADRFVPA